MSRIRHSLIVALLMLALLLGTRATYDGLVPFLAYLVLVGGFGFWWGYYDEGRRVQP